MYHTPMDTHEPTCHTRVDNQIGECKLRGESQLGQVKTSRAGTIDRGETFFFEKKKKQFYGSGDLFVVT